MASIRQWHTDLAGHSGLGPADPYEALPEEATFVHVSRRSSMNHRDHARIGPIGNWDIVATRLLGMFLRTRMAAEQLPCP
jgi:hypothetical protein